MKFSQTENLLNPSLMVTAMNGKHPSISLTLSEESLTHEGFIRFNGFPVAFVQSNLSVLLLLPFEELKFRPYYSATFNGFIELDYSVSRLSPRFTMALIAEWSSRYFGAPSDPARLAYVKSALKRLAGWHRGLTDLASALDEPDDSSHDYPISTRLTAEELKVLEDFPKESYPLYIVEALWSNHIRSLKSNHLPNREARRLVPIGSTFVPVVTSMDLLVKVTRNFQGLLGLCIRKVEYEREIKKVWFLPKKNGQWSFPMHKEFLTAQKMGKDLHRVNVSSVKQLDKTLSTLACTRDSSLSNKELEDIYMLLSDLEQSDEKLSKISAPLYELFLKDRSLTDILQEIESATQGKHSAFDIDPVLFAMSCALKAEEFQGESIKEEIQYCPMPDCEALEAFYQKG